LLKSGSDATAIVTRRLEGTMECPQRLRGLAAWYRDFAERAGNPVIWEARLITAERLDQEAERLETSLVSTKNL
jgi:hypothetical protein